MQKIGILETLEPNHVQALNALAKGYAVNKENEITLFVSNNTLQQIEHFNLHKIAKIITQPTGTTHKEFLKNIETLKLDRLHICSTKSEFADFEGFNPNTKQIFLHIHNTEIWFDNTIKKYIKTLVFDLLHDQSKRKKHRILASFIKNITLNQYYIENILKTWSKNNRLTLVVQNENMKSIIKEKSPQQETIVFPFSTYEQNSLKETTTTSKINRCDVLRIGICGTVTQDRRDYLGLFTSLKSLPGDFKPSLEFLLLGYINPREEKIFDQKIKELKEKNIKIHRLENTKITKNYEEGMQSCDILLNIVRVKKNAFSNYGLTKESGWVGDMIRSAKPGLLPEEYPLSKTFNNSTIKFKNLTHLLLIISKLSKSPTRMKELKEGALRTSLKFTPSELYQILEPTHHAIPTR